MEDKKIRNDEELIASLDLLLKAIQEEICADIAIAEIKDEDGNVIERMERNRENE